MGNFEVVPSVKLGSGLFVKGKIAGPAREVKCLKGTPREFTSWVHELFVMDASDGVKFEEKQKDKTYLEVQPEEGDKVAVWATKSLHEKLEMFPEGTVVRITEEGKEDAGGEFKRRKFIVKMEKE